jgi:Autophagy protein Atg8 ubiquitin like
MITYFPIIEKRKRDAEKARTQYPTKLPLIIERAPDQKKLDVLKNPK